MKRKKKLLTKAIAVILSIFMVVATLEISGLRSFAEGNENLFLASRNNDEVAVLAFDEINVLDLVAANYLVVDESSVKKIEEVLN